MSAPSLPTADDYWSGLTARSGVGREDGAFFGGHFTRTVIRTFDSIAGSGVLESLIGGSSSTGVEMWGRRYLRGSRTGHEWFHLDIAPAFTTWETRYEHSPPDANHGAEGLVSGSEHSPGPMPRAHIQHPSSLIYYEQFPMWGGIRHVADDYLPGPVEVLWQEAAEVGTGEPDWRSSPTPGHLARITLINTAHPDSDGTAIFDLCARVCLFFEISHSGEPDYRLVVDAIEAHGQRKAFTEFGAE